MKARRLDSQAESIKRTDLKGLKMDEWDRKNIAHMVQFFRNAFPGVIEEVTAQGRKETIPMTGPELQKALKSPLGIRRIAIPAGLWQVLKEAYPALQVDRRQFEQFLKWFPEFDLLRR